MTQREQLPKDRIWSIIKVVWTVMIVVASTWLGALIGLENYGIIGAIALGFVGLVAGVFLSSLTLLLQLIP